MVAEATDIVIGSHIQLKKNTKQPNDTRDFKIPLPVGEKNNDTDYQDQDVEWKSLIKAEVEIQYDIQEVDESY